MMFFITLLGLWALQAACIEAYNLAPRSSSLDAFDAAVIGSNSVSLEVSINNTAERNKTSPYLYGLLFEDISHSGDGGLYGELLMNRGFTGLRIPAVPSLEGWSPIGGANIHVDTVNPISKALKAVLKLKIPPGATGEVGFKNSGWWGISVRPQTYTASFYVKSSQSTKGKITTSLRSRSGDVYAGTTTDFKVGTDYRQVTAEVKNTGTAQNASRNAFCITFDAAEFAGQTLYFGLVSLFGETFKGRKNGLRKDLAEALHNLEPKFLRFPGGNNLEGISINTRWKWFETIGPLKDRPGRPGNWGYYNTDGLGLLEYLEWCEDMNMTPLLSVYAGFSLGKGAQNETSVPKDQMSWVLDEALGMLEYVTGPADSKYGSLRARDDHPEPFKLKFVEIGNEDWFSRTYNYRWRIMYDGLKAKYPKITFISTVLNESGYKLHLPPGTVWDTHHYEQPNYFIDKFDYFDNWQVRSNESDVGVIVGEYSVLQQDSPNGTINWSNTKANNLPYPDLKAAIAEAVYHLGIERNPNVVWMSTYAPILQRTESSNWSPDLVTFSTDPKYTTLSTSYWQRWMFAKYRGTHTLPIHSSNGTFSPLFWAASIDEPTGVVYVKVVNIAAESVPLSIAFDLEYKSAKGTILTSPGLYAFNEVANPNRIKPQPVSIPPWALQKGKFRFEVPRWSITVLQFRK